MVSRRSLFLIFICVCFFSQMSVLADTTVPTGISGGGAADFLNQTKPPSFARPDNEPGVKWTSSCEDAHGNKLDSGDSGYEACLKASGNRNGKTGATKPALGFKTKD